MEVTDGARAYLARKGYDPAFGARPLKRLIQRQVQDPLALYVLEAGIGEGTRIVVDVREDNAGLTFAPAEEQGEPAPASEAAGAGASR